MQPAMRASIQAVLFGLLAASFALASGDLRQAATQGPVVRQALTAGEEFKDGGALIIPCELVVVGQIVDERPRLAPDGTVVFTDYTIEINEVLIDPKARVAPGARLVVSNPGGQMRVEGVPVRVETPDFQPLEWLVPYIFFLDPAADGYRFRGGAQGVWAIREEHVHSHLTRKFDYTVRRLYNGNDLGLFSRRVRNTGQSNPPPRASAPAKPTGERRREVIRPDYPKIPGLGERRMAADAVLRGRVVGAEVQMSDDGKTAWTDYTIEVLEVYKHPSPAPAAGATLAARAEGGNFVHGEDVVSIVNELFPPLPWAREHIFFLQRPKPEEPYRFLDGAMSVFRRDDEGRMRCHAPRAAWDFLCTSRDGRKWEELVRDVSRGR
jgi:hypothetical protein